MSEKWPKGHSKDSCTELAHITHKALSSENILMEPCEELPFLDNFSPNQPSLLQRLNSIRWFLANRNGLFDTKWIVTPRPISHVSRSNSFSIDYLVISLKFQNQYVLKQMKSKILTQLDSHKHRHDTVDKLVLGSISIINWSVPSWLVPRAHGYLSSFFVQQ